MLAFEGCALHYWSHGDPAAPAVVLTHGATLDHESWTAQTDALAGRYHVITWDMRGHGLSQPLNGRFTMARGAADLVALLDHLGIERVALVGLSLGSYVSQRLLYDRPERVAALLSFDATSRTGLALGPVMRALLAVSDKLLMVYPHGALVETIARSAALRPEVQDYIRRVVRRLDKRTIIDIWSAVQTGLVDEPDYFEPVPLMIAVGEKDRVGLSYRGAVQWSRVRPEAQFEIIPDAGHCANQDNPGAVTRLIGDFLEVHWPGA